jgi:predicted ATPase
MFDYIKIEGFRSFKNVELEMPRLAVLIGPNGGGKSNFIDLMSLMSEAAQGHLSDAIAGRGGFRSVAFGFDWFGEIQLGFRFRGKTYPEGPIPGPPPLSGELGRDVRFKLGLKGEPWAPVVTLEEITEEPTPERPQATSVIRRSRESCVFGDRGPSLSGVPYARTLESQSELAISQIKDLYQYPIPYALSRQFEQWAFYREIYVGPKAHVRLPTLLRPLTRLAEHDEDANLSAVLHTIKERYHETWEEVLELLHTACPGFRDIRIPGEGGDGKVLLRWCEDPYAKDGISANLLSDGTLKLLCLIAILKSPNPPPLICIDEPELGLHPDWIELVAELMQDAAARTQVIVATHSPHIVAKLDPDQVIVTEKENGETRLERLSAKDLEKWLRDFNLADLWLAGHIGGRP